MFSKLYNLGIAVEISCDDSSQVSGFLFTFYITLISSITSLIICLATNNLALPSTLLGWELCVLFSLLVTTGAVMLFQQSTFLIGGERVAAVGVQRSRAVGKAHTGHRNRRTSLHPRQG